jgi:hypothetical protein
MKNEISTAHMTQGNLTIFAEDRFGNANAALALNGGYTQIPSGVYFNSPEFTISAWIYPQQVVDMARLIDFGNGQNANNLIATISYGLTLNPSLNILTGSTTVVRAISTQKLKLNQWQFLALTFNGTYSSVYINGSLTAETNNTFTMPTLTRSLCFVGKSNWAANGYSSSYVDELKFFNKSLTQQEIISLMSLNETSKHFDYF